MNPLPPKSPPLIKAGAVYALFAYAAWGLLPIYWKLFGQTSPIEVLSHRIIWSGLFLMGLLLVQQRRSELGLLWKSPKNLMILFLTASLLSFNWGLYIYGVNTDRVIETSLGYYINPLVNVTLGALFLQERLNRKQKLAVLLAGVGVGYFVLHFGQVPFIALGLAFSFAFYGLLRKIVPVAPLIGLAVETLLVAPLAIAFVGFESAVGGGHLGVDWRLTGLFIGSGVMTSLPLLWFNNAAKRLRLSTLGFFQYLAPSLGLIIGVFLYHEPFTQTHAVTFGLIWSAIALYLYASTERSNTHSTPNPTAKEP